ncbi:MAG: hypothetical protein KZQ82_20815 [Candidatus Thiodiazotropha sp. (ex Lucinoma annulata)]|nr:hypothetical protein [Candidatus Thiodiazotropha sp. (ex Lucinoma annulata)]
MKNVVSIISGEVQSEIGPLIEKLHVLSREFTGVGSYINLDCPDSEPELGEKSIGLNALISMPNVPNGMGAVLFCENSKPKCLEIYTFGNEHWDGVYEGFSIEKNT